MGAEDDVVSADVRVTVVHVYISNVLRKLLIRLAIRGVKQEEEDIETRKEGSREVNVLNGRDARVVAAVDRVSGGEDGGSGVQGGGNTSLGDGDGLLLHDFVNCRAIVVVHLVEFIDGADAVVSEHKGATLEDHLVGDGITHHGGGKTDSTASTTRGVDTTGSHLGDVLEKLRLGNTRVTHEADVDITTNLHAVTNLLCNTTNEEEKKRLLYVEMTVDFGGNRLCEEFIDLAGLAVLLDTADKGVIDDHLTVCLLVLKNVVRLEVCVCEESGFHGLEAGIRRGQEDTRDVNDIARVDLANEATKTVNRQGTRDLANGDLLGHFLDLDLLEGQELGSSRRGVELTLGLVVLAVRRRAHAERSKLLVGDGLEDFATATVASVGADLDNRLDVRDTGSDGAHGDELAKVLAADLTDCESLGRLALDECPWLEDERVPPCELGRELLCVDGGIPLGNFFHLPVASLSPGHQYVEYIVLEAASRLAQSCYVGLGVTYVTSVLGVGRTLSTARDKIST